MAATASRRNGRRRLGTRSLVLALALAVVVGLLAPEVADARARRGGRPKATSSARKRSAKPRRARRARSAAPRRASGPQPCRYARGGSVHPVCRGGRTMAHVWVANVPGTNMTVNVAFSPTVTRFVEAGRGAGLDLQANDVAGPGQGSYRTRAMQTDLRRRGFPANRPGTSMHEWGLAVDLSCNGRPFMDHSNAFCRHWVRTNASRFGMYPHPGEPWHYSSNGQ